MSVDYWITNFKAHDTSVSFLATQLSTWAQDTVEVDKDAFKVSLTSLGIPASISMLEDSVLSLNKKLLVEEYVANVKQDIVPDIHEPVDVVGILGIRPTALYAGDYFFKTKDNKIVLIERKRLENGELVSCLTKHSKILESKLTSQARRMQPIGDINILLIDLGFFQIERPSGKIKLPKSGKKSKGSTNKNPVYQLRFVDMQKQLRSLNDTWGLYPWLSYDKDTVGEDIFEIRNYFNKGDHSSQSIVDGFIPPANILVYPAQVQALCFIAGMGPTLATRALKHFGSLKAAVSGTVKQWMDIDGIGVTKGNKIVKELSKSF